VGVANHAVSVTYTLSPITATNPGDYTAPLTGTRQLGLADGGVSSRQPRR
jgi:hypothetical protein